MVAATKGGAYLKVSAEQAAEATAGLVQLMPEEWRGDPGVPALANLPNRPDCEPVLKELTRGVPLHMLLDRGEDSLHPKNDRSLLSAPDFFLSTPSDIHAFISHRWAADPSMTVQALHMAVILRFGATLFNRVENDPFLCPIVLHCLHRRPHLRDRVLRVYVPSVIWYVFLTALLCVFIFPVPLLYCVCPIGAYIFLNVLDINSKVARLLFANKAHPQMGPVLWFDKASVHQTEPCLNQAGIALFPYYLDKAKELWILFTPEYLTRVWCIYELANWLHTKPDAPIFLVPLQRNSRLFRSVLRWWPWFVFALFFCLGIAVFGIVMLHQRKSIEFIREMVWTVATTVVYPIVSASVVFLCCLLVWPMRQERVNIARQLKDFDVANCSAFYEKDKAYVLGLVAEWFGTGGKDDDRAALEQFNELVRTRVAQRLRRALLAGEARMAAFFVLLGVLAMVVVAIVCGVRPSPFEP